MFCAKCGEQLADDARFCLKCGTPADGAVNQPLPASPPPQPSSQPQFRPTSPPSYAPPATPAFQYAPPQVPPPPLSPYAQPRKKRHIGCFIVLFLFLALIGAGLYLLAQFFWASPRDLGIRYTQADFDSAMTKVGLKVDFMGKSNAELTALIKAHREEEIPIDDYTWVFSDYQERSFQLTPAEATAFINEIAPPFSWFQDAQMKVFSDGHSAGSYKVRFDKVKEELIPDIADKIPKALADLLPDTFNLYMEGNFEIKENEVSVPEKLDRLEVGVIPLQPVIGDLTNQERSAVFDYAERIYKQIPNLMIHTLKTDKSGNFDVSVYMPTKVTLKEK